MFEVIISTVKTGQVERQAFPTRDAANRHIDRQQLRWARLGQSARCYRVEIERRPPPAPAPLQLPAAA